MTETRISAPPISLGPWLSRVPAASGRDRRRRSPPTPDSTHCRSRGRFQAPMSMTRDCHYGRCGGSRGTGLVDMAADPLRDHDPRRHGFGGGERHRRVRTRQMNGLAARPWDTRSHLGCPRHPGKAAQPSSDLAGVPSALWGAGVCCQERSSCNSWRILSISASWAAMWSWIARAVWSTASAS